MADMTASQMVADEVCSGSCLTAAGPHTPACKCRCGGRWHGALANVVVLESAPHRRPRPAPQDGPDMFRDDDHSEPYQGLLCEQCDGLVNPKQAGAGFTRCGRCDPFGRHVALTPGGPCQVCTTVPVLAGAPN